jgi:hypothetical protein
MIDMQICLLTLHSSKSILGLDLLLLMELNSNSLAPISLRPFLAVAETRSYQATDFLHWYVNFCSALLLKSWSSENCTSSTEYSICNKSSAMKSTNLNDASFWLTQLLIKISSDGQCICLLWALPKTADHEFFYIVVKHLFSQSEQAYYNRW